MTAVEDEQAATVPLRREVALFLGIAFGTSWTLHLTLAGAADRYEAQDRRLSTSRAFSDPPWRRSSPSGSDGAPERHAGSWRERGDARQRHRSAPRSPSLPPSSWSRDWPAVTPRSASSPPWPRHRRGVVLGEEPGWRGWLWPRLADRLGATVGTLLVTAVWATWHLPMFLVPGSPQPTDGIIAFAAAVAAWGLVHGVLQSMRRSVLAAMAFHAAATIAVSSVDVERAARSLAFLAVAAIAVVLLARRDLSAQIAEQADTTAPADRSGTHRSPT